jgi:hypothetical protein
MPVELTEQERSERAVQEKAQRLVARGQLETAVRLLDGFLARYDGDWGTWLYFAGLCARLGWKDQAVAAYRASSRQLEGEERFARARDALLEAMKVAPRDVSLARDAVRLERLLRPVEMTSMLDEEEDAPTCVFEPVAADAGFVRERGGAPRPSPSVDLRPRKGPDPFSLVVEAPAEFRPVSSLMEKTAIAKKRREPKTEPHFAIFDVIDAARRRAG